MTPEMASEFQQYVNSIPERRSQAYAQKELIESEMDMDILTSKMKFGKHKGTEIAYLPHDYIRWLLKNDVLKNKSEKHQLSLLLKLAECEDRISYLLRDPYD